MTKQQLLSDFPTFRFIDEMTPEALTAYLSARKTPGLDGIRVESSAPLGDGNMNITRLLKTNLGAFVIKQSVPWVAKYPSIAAPWDRSIREASFYQTVGEIEAVSQNMPQLLDVDLGNRTLLFTFEANTRDCSVVYVNPHALTVEHAEAAAEWLVALHSAKIDLERSPRITNRDMRALNHEHIFDIPFRKQNGLDLDAMTPGLQVAAEELLEDGKLAQIARDLGEEYYLKDGEALIHGDFFPGSWLQRANKIVVIDPEFAFTGHAIFDVSVAMAHFKMANCPEEIGQTFLETYQASLDVDEKLLNALSGIEILRRLLGVAQLPLSAGIVEKTRWIKEARADILAI